VVLGLQEWHHACTKPVLLIPKDSLLNRWEAENREAAPRSTADK